MKWEDVKKEITSISEEEKQYIEMVADIVTVREDKGITQTQLAEMTGLKQPAIARFEDPSKGAANIITVMKIANALGYKLNFEK
ncbi:helix-turn-helix transcriptional regulator [Priestia megaterium]